MLTERSVALVRLTPLIRLASEYLTAQILSRVLAAISGLLLVRNMAVSEYGYYTLLLMVFTFICTFSDLGVTETLSFFRWHAGTKNRPWTHYVHAVFSFRRRAFIIGSIAAGVYVLHISGNIDKALGTSIAAIAITGVAGWFAIDSGTASYVLKLKQHFRQAYAVDIFNEGTKLLVVVLLCVVGVASSLAGMVSVASGALAASLLATRFLGQTTGAENHSRRHSYQRRRVLLRQIAPVLPGTIVFSLQGPLIAWLATTYGSVINLAEVGALGRLALIIGMVAGFTNSVFIPRLLSIGEESLFRRRYLQWWLVVLGYAVLMMSTVIAFPEALLWLLGGSYGGLKDELVIVSGTAILGTWSAYSWTVNRGRGWTKYQPYRVPTMVIGQLGLFFILDLSTSQGILLFGFWSIAVDVCFQTLINLIGLFGVSLSPGKLKQ